MAKLVTGSNNFAQQYSNAVNTVLNGLGNAMFNSFDSMWTGTGGMNGFDTLTIAPGTVITTSIEDGSIIMGDPSEFSQVTRKKASAALVKRPVPVAVAVAEPVDTEWLALMNQLEIKLPAGIDTPLARFLQREEIVVYPKEQVLAWLQVKANEAWLAKSDEWRQRNVVQVTHSWFGGKEIPGITKYSEVVPKEALGIMSKIKAEFPNCAFQVAHLSEKRMDPFLLALLGDERHYVAMWDEPGFSIVKPVEAK